MCFSKRPARLFFQGNLHVSHCQLPRFLQFFYGFAAYSSYLSCVAQALQAFHRCGNNVLRVVGTQALGTDVLDAGSLNYCTNSAAGDNAGYREQQA